MLLQSQNIIFWCLASSDLLPFKKKKKKNTDFLHNCAVLFHLLASELRSLIVLLHRRTQTKQRGISNRSLVVYLDYEELKVLLWFSPVRKTINHFCPTLWDQILIKFSWVWEFLWFQKLVSSRVQKRRAIFLLRRSKSQTVHRSTQDPRRWWMSQWPWNIAGKGGQGPAAGCHSPVCPSGSVSWGLGVQQGRWRDSAPVLVDSTNCLQDRQFPHKQLITNSFILMSQSIGSLHDDKQTIFPRRPFSSHVMLRVAWLASVRQRLTLAFKINFVL